jgi:hypothetical protein
MRKDDEAHDPSKGHPADDGAGSHMYLSEKDIVSLLFILGYEGQEELKAHLLREYGAGGWIHHINLAAADALEGCDRYECVCCGWCKPLWGRQLLDSVLMAIGEFYAAGLNGGPAV